MVEELGGQGTVEGEPEVGDGGGKGLDLVGFVGGVVKSHAVGGKKPLIGAVEGQLSLKDPKQLAERARPVFLPLLVGETVAAGGAHGKGCLEEGPGGRAEEELVGIHAATKVLELHQ